MASRSVRLGWVGEFITTHGAPSYALPVVRNPVPTLTSDAQNRWRFRTVGKHSSLAASVMTRPAGRRAAV